MDPESDLAFSQAADAFMQDVLTRLDRLDPDDIDCELSAGVLTITFSDKRKCVMNRQSAARQIWLAVGTTAWHFDHDRQSNRWTDTKGRGDLRPILAAALSERLGYDVSL